MADNKKNLIISELETMEQGDIIRGEKFSALAYRKVINGLRPLEAIRTIADIEGIKGIGVKIKAKIQEILDTGGLKAAAETRVELKMDLYNQLLRVHGIGPVKARELVAAGVTSIEDLRTKTRLLNDVQVMGLKYYEDILQRIPREEMLAHEKWLKAALPSECQGDIVGSFRRQAATSGDIDMLITIPDVDAKPAAQKKVFHDYVEKLRRSGYIKDILALGDKKCMAVVKLCETAKARRLDLLLTPYKEYAYAVLYFTGSDTFNVAFRSHALTRGYTLNEHILKPLAADAVAAPFMPDEQAIFEFLRLQYVEPAARVGETAVTKISE